MYTFTHTTGRITNILLVSVHSHLHQAEWVVFMVAFGADCEFFFHMNVQ